MFYSLESEDRSYRSAYFDPLEGQVVGSIIGDIMMAGGVSDFFVSEAFVKCASGLSGVRFERVEVPSINRQFYSVVVEGVVPYDYQAHASAHDYQLHPTENVPGFEPVWTYRKYMPVPDGADTPDVFRNGSVNSIWVTEAAVNKLTSCGLANVELRPAEDFKPIIEESSLREILGARGETLQDG